MNAAIPRRANHAFTLIELLVVVVIVGVMVAMLCPVNRPGKASSVICMNNLKQVGLGLMMYASDHADQFPWQISTNSTVTGQTVESRPAFEYFLMLTNYQFPPSILVCPTDKARTRATNYSHFNNTNLSYFAALSATATSGSNVWRLILAGDRHLSVDGQAVKPGVYTLNESSVPAWTKALHKAENGLTRGNLLFADGHVQFVAEKYLPREFRGQLVTTTRLAIP